MWYLYIIEYYAGIKNNELLVFVTTSMDLEDIILSERNQKKTNTIWCHLCMEA